MLPTLQCTLFPTHTAMRQFTTPWLISLLANLSAASYTPLLYHGRLLNPHKGALGVWCKHFALGLHVSSDTEELFQALPSIINHHKQNHHKLAFMD